MKKILETKKLCKSFGAIKVADELNFHVAENEALGIIGPNGAGKTSLFNLITGTIKQDKGNIFYQEDVFFFKQTLISQLHFFWNFEFAKLSNEF